MAMNTFDDSSEAIMGRLAEAVFCEMAIRAGLSYVPFSKILAEGAPMLIGLDKRYVLPDYLCGRQGRSNLWDVKGKTRATEFKKTGTMQTGCLTRHYNDYLSVQKILGLPCRLIFIHAEENAMYCQFLDQLSPDHEARGGGRRNEPTLYFNLDDFGYAQLADTPVVRQFREFCLGPSPISQRS